MAAGRPRNPPGTRPSGHSRRPERAEKKSVGKSWIPTACRASASVIPASTRLFSALERIITSARRTTFKQLRATVGDDPAGREGVPDIRAAHTLDPEGQGGMPGVPVRVLDDRHGLILHHEVMWKSGDVDHAVPMVEAAQARFPDLRAVSFDRGFHSPGNRVRPDGMPGCDAMPGKGYLNQAGRERESGDGSAAMRRRHPAVGSVTDSPGHRGLDRILAFGAGGFERTIALAVVATDVHRIGPLPLRKARKRQRRAAPPDGGPASHRRPGTRAARER